MGDREFLEVPLVLRKKSGLVSEILQLRKENAELTRKNDIFAICMAEVYAYEQGSRVNTLQAIVEYCLKAIKNEKVEVDYGVSDNNRS